MVKRIAKCVYCHEIVDVDAPLIPDEIIEKFGLPTGLLQTVCEKCRKAHEKQ